MKAHPVYSTQETSLLAWGKNGYIETWCGYDKSYQKEIQDFIKKELGNSKSKVTLEIGAGGGYWTGFLNEHSKKVIAIDVIEKPEQIEEDVIWQVNRSNQFDCSCRIEQCSIDFVFSFGTFCHFSIEQCELYLQDIYRVMKSGASAILMYSDGKKYPNVFEDYNDFYLTTQMVGKFSRFKHKRLLDFRDTLLLINKI